MDNIETVKNLKNSFQVILRELGNVENILN